MGEILVGVIGLAVLAVGFGVLGRLAPRQRKGSCGGCALSATCGNRRIDESPRGAERETCYVGGANENDRGAS